MLFPRAHNTTIITVDPKDHLTLVAPFLRASGREAVSRFDEELRVYAVCMASHASSRPRSSSRSRPLSAEAEKAEIPTDQYKPQADDHLITCPSYPSSVPESPTKPSCLNPSSSFVFTPLSRVAKEASLSDEFRPTSLRTDTSSLVPLGKAPGSSNKSLSLEANPDLDSDLEPVYADCAQHDGGVTELGSSFTKRSNINHHDNKVPSTTTNPCHSSDCCHASVIIPNPKIFIPLKELNKPMDRKLLHLRIFAEKDQIIYGMIDTGTTISCIPRDLVKVARLKPTGSSLKLNSADNNSVECQLVSRTLAFAFGGTAKLTYVSTTLAVL
ncbi:hypothetical protein P9112_000639 [Eukaryota sp. TZLM1-RC]